jgi:hypothetical protein
LARYIFFRFVVFRGPTRVWERVDNKPYIEHCIFLAR